jgi:hypothetical protein
MNSDAFCGRNRRVGVALRTLWVLLAMTHVSNAAAANSHSRLFSRPAEILSVDVSTDGTRAAIVWQLGRYIDLVDASAGSLLFRWDRELAGPRFANFLAENRSEILIPPFMHKSLSREQFLGAAAMIMDASSDVVLDVIRNDNGMLKGVPEKAIVSPDGNLIAFGFAAPGRHVMIYDLRTRKIKAFLQLKHEETLSALDFSPDNRFVAVGTRAGSLVVFAIDNASRLFSVAVTNFSIGSLGYSPDGAKIAVGEAEGWGENQKKTGILLFSGGDGQLMATSTGSFGGTKALIWLRNGDLITGSGDGILRQWRADLTHDRAVFTGRHRINAVAYSPSKNLVYTATGSELVVVRVSD